MAVDPKADSRALVPHGDDESTNAELDTALAGVEGKVRSSVVNKLRKLVDKNPDAFVRGMRTLLHSGRSDD